MAAAETKPTGWAPGGPQGVALGAKPMGGPGGPGGLKAVWLPQEMPLWSILPAQRRLAGYSGRALGVDQQGGDGRAG